MWAQLSLCDTSIVKVVAYALIVVYSAVIVLMVVFGLGWPRNQWARAVAIVLGIPGLAGC